MSSSYLPVGLWPSLALGLFFGLPACYTSVMTCVLRSARNDELDILSALCLRSKAHWGYDRTFLEACREELTLTHEDLNDRLIVAEKEGRAAGVAQVAPLDTGADLLLFFVDPPCIGQGVGRALFDWVLERCRAMSADRLMIEADPGAAPIYEHMGARRVGEVASRSIPGRMLPLLQFDLR